ncbi:EAL domain-containing protein [Rhodopseudomonas boonkerdii]|nr:EAL domain-containing protein [Rhodopseudomonas boonkerdii]UGV28592.1 EAL domain-containing protein [Rhodopseudomonas boonkerdii]
MQNASAPNSPLPSEDTDRPPNLSLTGVGVSTHDILAAEFSTLREIIRMLPSAVTVQDEKGEFLLVNDAATAQFGILPENFRAGNEPSDFVKQALSHRRLTALDLMQSGRTAVFEERVNSEFDKRVYLTTHRPVQIGDRTLLLSSASDISRQKRIEEELFRCAYYDELTDLPTRRVIEKHVGNLIADDGRSSEGRQGHFALAFLDIDNFKHINDYYGHGTGDGLLVQIAKRISLELRPTDMLSRISGDEFLLLLNPILSQQEVADYLERLVQRLRAPFFIEASEIFATASIGVSLYPEHGLAYDTLHQNADIAMYQVKNDTKGAAVFFNSGMESEALARMATEQALRLAVLDKRFCCAFQPKVDIRTKEIQGIEALVRLRDDKGVIQAPGAFINLAVELGLIDELTHLVLAEIMKSIDLIDEAFGSGATISINVAAKQAGNTEFMRSFARALKETGCPTRFMVEVTEDAFVAKTHFQGDILPMLREIGVGVSIDDFGVGYSSLSALADITADEIKIDRSFITDIHKRPRSQGILRAIESLSEALGMKVIAEGVETFEELAYLQAATKIRYAQGYYFSEPIFLEELQPQSNSHVRMALNTRSSDSARPAYSRAGGREY